MILHINWLSITELFGIGILSGALGSLLGIGGGVINVPFILQLGALPSVARSAGLILSSITGISSFVTHKKSGTISFKELIPFIPWALIGVFIGVGFQFLFKLVFPSANYSVVFKSIFLVILIISLYKMLKQKFFTHKKNLEDTTSALSETPDNPNDDIETEEKINPNIKKTYFKALVSIPGGFLAGLLGIGGGVYYGPILKTVVKYPIKKAIPISSGLIAISVPTGALLSNVIFLVTHKYNLFYQSLTISALIGLGTLVGVYLGVIVFRKLKSSVLNIIYILLILFNSVKLFISIFIR